jgi:hypothetical protein
MTPIEMDALAEEYGTEIKVEDERIPFLTQADVIRMLEAQNGKIR